MTTTAARAEVPPRPTFAQKAMALPSRAAPFFSGPVGLAIKIFLLAIDERARGLGRDRARRRGEVAAVAVLAVTTILIDVAYLSRRALPLKFLIPGTVLMIAFQVIPIFYTVNVAFTNYSTGHILSKDEAIVGIKGNSLAPPPDGKSYLMAPGARRRRRARAAPRRRGHRQHVRRDDGRAAVRSSEAAWRSTTSGS